MQTPCIDDLLSQSSDLMVLPSNQQSYVYRTIHQQNRNRLSILPIYPTSLNQRELLLANVPNHLLSQEEVFRRQRNFYTFPYQFPLNDVHYRSDLAEYYQRFYVDLMTRLQIDPIILDCNYVRLRHCLDLFADNRSRHLRTSYFDVQIREHERSLAMEFYLQIDVDLFYMKSTHESLFCQDEPNCCFAMQPCHQCELCSTRYKNLNRTVPSIDMNATSRFIFRNGYQTILNANTTCTTRNIIYVLRCRCQEYEYIGETASHLISNLAKIRKTSMQHIHEQLLGHSNANEQPIEYARLYQHLARCPLALQTFLDHNSRYWRFIPMINQEAEKQNSTYVSPWKSRNRRKEDDLIDDLLKKVPLPPAGYRFTNEQYDQQRRFFQRADHQRLPEAELDLFRAMILIVVPEQTSNALRQFIQALLITHSEANLNVIGHLVYSPEQPVSSEIWCHGLLRRRF